MTFLEVSRVDSTSHISRHANWVSLFHDSRLELYNHYASPSSMGKAVNKVLNGRAVPGLSAFRIVLLLRTDDKEEVQPSKPQTVPTLPPYEIISRDHASSLKRTHPCQHRCISKLKCSHPCCKIYGPSLDQGIEGDSGGSPNAGQEQEYPELNPPTSASSPRPLDETEYLFRTARYIQGGKLNINLADAHWHEVERKALHRCNTLLTVSGDALSAVHNAELLSAILAVSAYEVARDVDSRKGFIIRTARGHIKGKVRPLESEKVAFSFSRHVKQLQMKLRYTHGKAPRMALKQKIKETKKAERIYSAEAMAQKRELESRWALQQFNRNPWTAASQTLDKRTEAESVPAYPTCNVQKVESVFTTLLTDPTTVHHLPPHDVLGNRPLAEMTWDELASIDISNALTSKKNSSAPGQDSITYQTLKRCHSSHTHMANVFNALVRFSTCPTSWKISVTRLIYKKGEPDNPQNWRPIGLTSVLGKLLHSIISRKMTKFLIEASVIDPKIQKGFLPAINGTLEHTQSLSELLRHYRKNKWNYCMAQLDLSNAFGSVPRNIIFEALEWARISPNIIKYVQCLYTDASTRIKCYEGLSSAIPAKRGVLQGDTLSPTLFLVIMELALRYMAKSFPSFGLNLPGFPKSFLKAYADDLTVLTNSEKEMQLAVETLSTVLGSLGLSINVKKCRVQYMASKKNDEHPGYMTRRPQIFIKNEAIPHICDEGSTFLGMNIALGSQQSRALFTKVRPLLKRWLHNIDQSAHDLPSKIWIYQHAIISRLRFTFTIHPCITLNFILRLQKMCTHSLKRWINAARTTCSEAIYSQRGWNICSLSRLWEDCTADLLCQMKRSRDPNVTAALQERIRAEEHKRRKGQIRPACDITHTGGSRPRKTNSS